MKTPNLEIVSTLALITASWEIDNWSDVDQHMSTCYEMARELQRLHGGKCVMMHLGKMTTIILEEDIHMNITPLDSTGTTW